MPINSTGPLGLDANIKAEFDGTRPVSIGQYYRGGPLVPDVSTNVNVPTTGPISFSTFYGAANVIAVTYQIIGGGGGGGAGADDGTPFAGTFAPAGGNSSIIGGSVSIQASGGSGGQSTDPLLRTAPWAGTDGGSSAYGVGGAGASEDSIGGNATGFGAGGGGGGGDSPNTFDSSGAGGRGGDAGTGVSGTFNATLDQDVIFTVTIGGAGGGDRRGYPGGNGSAGYGLISFGGNQYTFVGNGTIAIPSGTVTGGSIPPAIIPGQQPPPPPPPEDISCFVAGTIVSMANGTQKKIQDVVIGDQLLGQDGAVNTVLGYDYANLAGRRLVGINNLGKLKTPEHPLYTREGWKSYCPSTFRRDFPDMAHLNVTELTVGDAIQTLEGNWLEVTSLEVYQDQPDQTVYNFILDGNHTYYANGLLTHNRD